MAGPLTPHQLDLTTTLAAAELTDDNRVIVLVIAAVAIAALAVAVVLVRQVLASRSAPAAWSAFLTVGLGLFGAASSC
jgi:hypothetical protein